MRYVFRRTLGVLPLVRVADTETSQNMPRSCSRVRLVSLAFLQYRGSPLDDLLAMCYGRSSQGRLGSRPGVIEVLCYLSNPKFFA